MYFNTDGLYYNFHRLTAKPGWSSQTHTGQSHRGKKRRRKPTVSAPTYDLLHDLGRQTTREFFSNVVHQFVDDVVSTNRHAFGACQLLHGLGAVYVEAVHYTCRGRRM